MFESNKYLPNPHDPFQAPNLRWHRCLYLVRHRRRPSVTRDDDATRAGWRYLPDRRMCRKRGGLERLAKLHPNIVAAYRLFRCAEPLQRAEVEARLLARQSDKDIAAKCGLTAAAVATYHRLFFRVRDALDAKAYICNAVIGAKAHAGLSEQDEGILLKLLGYAHGPLRVDLALRYFRNPPALPSRLDDLDAAALAELRLMLRLRILILTMTAPVHAIAGRKIRPTSKSMEDESVAPRAEESADPSVTAFLREQVRVLTEAGLPNILPFDRSALQHSPEELEAWLAALCG